MNTDPFIIVGGLILLALVPFVAMMVTSYTKMVVVFSLVRNALGVQQVPPNMVINGMAIVFSIYVMAPVGYRMYTEVVKQKIDFENQKLTTIVGSLWQAKEPLRDFLDKHTNPREKAFFKKSVKVVWPEDAMDPEAGDLIVLIPAFTVSELTSAFEIGFLIFLPFVAIDMIVSNILLSLGMMMVSPMVISMPFKLLLFVLADGWTKITHGLVLCYG